MITKTPVWDMISEGLKSFHRSKKITDAVMSKIRELEVKDVKSSSS
jgi:hypothetical protein